MKKILFIGKENLITKEITLCLTKMFDVVMIDITRDNIRSATQGIDCILIYLRNLDSRTISLINMMLKDEGRNRTVTMILGNDEEIDNYRKIVTRVPDREFHGNVSSVEIRNEIYEILRYNDLFTETHLSEERVDEVEPKHILIVDDEVNILQAVRRWLRNDYNTYIVNSGAAALKFLNVRIPDMILLDYSMPEMDGLETLAQIRQNPAAAQIPVLFLTGVNEKKMIQTALMLKPQGYILKTVKKEELLNIIEKYFIDHESD